MRTPESGVLLGQKGEQRLVGQSPERKISKHLEDDVLCTVAN